MAACNASLLLHEAKAADEKDDLIFILIDQDRIAREPTRWTA
jgi:hypothetical protein